MLDEPLTVADAQLLPRAVKMEQRVFSPLQKAYSFVKRGSDILLSFIGLAICILPMLVFGVVIRATSAGPAVFRQRRVGQKGRVFVIHKFRTMSVEAPNLVATKEFSDAQSYITGIGRFLRRLSLDELPQLWDVFVGNMSLIGPRPLIESETEMHEMRGANNVYLLRPGMTGLAQVNGRDAVQNDEKLSYDQHYLQNFSFKQDISIAVKTLVVVLQREGILDGKAEKEARLPQTDGDVSDVDSVSSDDQCA